jgi:ATP-dependent Clp protease ATP-binding subunit ClpA
VFERFTERARQVIVLAQDESRAARHVYIGTEHILLGLLREEEGLAARVLESLGVSLEDTRARILDFVPMGEEPVTGQIPFTPRGKKVLELALREGLSLSHSYIGTEHILLGLIREGQGVAAQVLKEQGLDVDKIREETLRMLSSPRSGSAWPGLLDVGQAQLRVAQGSYEHLVLGLDPRDLLAGIEEVAAEGWELVSVTADPTDLAGPPLAYLRRPAPGRRDRPGRKRPRR